MNAELWLICNLLCYATCSLTTSGSYFQLHYGKDTSEVSLTPEKVQCEQDERCTYVVRVKGGKVIIVRGENELRHIKDVVCIWRKVVAETQTTPAPLKGCSSTFALGMEKNDSKHGVVKIPNGNIQAPSHHSSNHPSEARLNGNKFWSPTQKSGSYLQVYFGRAVWLHAIATQGSSPSWTKDYELSYRNDGSNFEFVMSIGTTSPKVFIGNTDGDTAVKNLLPTPVAMKYVRIYPVSYHGNIALRVEFYGCFK